MPSTFFGLNTAYTGLLGANAALNTTSNNISNAQTEGYSRQKVYAEAADALRVWTTYGCAGAGVDVLSIERVHDDFYDNKYWATNTDCGQYNMKQYYMTQIEDYFRDDSTIEGFSTIFDRMMSALAEVKKNPASDSTKAQFIGFADNLCEYFNSMSSNMEHVQKDINQEIKLKIDEINSLASEIATIDKQINVIEMAFGNANELRDKRTLLLDQLSAIVNVDVKEYKITDSNNPDRETGGTRLVVKIAGGQTLIDSDDYNTLTCIARTNDEKAHQSDIDGLYDVYWVTNINTGALGDQFNLYNTLLGGELQGLIELRDGNNTENFRGTISEIQHVSTKDPETEHELRKIQIEVADDYLFDLNKTTLSDTGGKITLANQEYYYKDWAYAYDATTGKCTYTFTIDETQSELQVTSSKVGREASVGVSINYQGVPYYMQQLNEWTRIFSSAFNNILQSGYTVDGKQGVILFTGNHATDKDQYMFDEAAYNQKDADGHRISESVYMTQDSYYWLTAKNFTVLTAMINNSDLLATKEQQYSGTDEYGNVGKLIDMTHDDKVASYRGASTSEFLTCVLSDVALNTNNAKVFYQNYSNIGKNIDNQRISISGVDDDDEAVDLIKYQNAYTMCSKMIQTLTEVYDRLILETGV